MGFSSQSDVEVSTRGRKQGNQSFSNGFSLNGAVGYQFEEVRTELEIGTRFFSGNSFSYPNGRKVSSTGNITATSVLINGYYDIPTSSKLRPYIGAGLGLAFTSGDIDTIDIDGNSFAYNLKGGIQYEVNYKGNIFAELKYASIGGYKLKNTIADIDSVNSFGLSIGYRQGF
ncbi:outer membrane beta-barrel protein [Cylindrospermopsis raciborskii CS-506_B]|nr:outer membrane beta-barrel protein [Cylindrospermopsis raciborskii CS-506_B]